VAEMLHTVGMKIEFKCHTLKVKVSVNDKPHKFGYKHLCRAEIRALLTRLKFIVGRKMILNSGILRNLVWEQVAAL